mmetsp:Transcript_18179/g.26021  ORF Transcript_18179/g.26021 Transcript_18179/m.26021 type:complete len:171 (+) Transcript_18179:1653-2165(+)
MIAATVPVTIATSGHTDMVSFSEDAEFDIQKNVPSAQMNEARATSPNTSILMEQSKPGIKELGITLAKLQERQKVMLGRLLHDLHQLAEEAKEGRKSSMYTEDLRNIEEHSTRTESSRLKTDTTFIDVPSESLSDLSSHAAWKMIACLRGGEMFSQDDLKRVLCIPTDCH